MLQYNVLGVARFLQVYAHDYDQNKANGMSNYDPLQTLGCGGTCRPRSEHRAGILDKNPDIASALSSGQELTEEQAQRVADAFDAALAAGAFKAGYQVCTGLLGLCSAAQVEPCFALPCWSRLSLSWGDAVTICQKTSSDCR